MLIQTVASKHSIYHSSETRKRFSTLLHRDDKAAGAEDIHEWGREGGILTVRSFHREFKRIVAICQTVLNQFTLRQQIIIVLSVRRMGYYRGFRDTKDTFIKWQRQEYNEYPRSDEKIYYVYTHTSSAHTPNRHEKFNLIRKKIK